MPVRLSLEVYEALQRIAPGGDVQKLIQETIEKLIQTSTCLEVSPEWRALVGYNLSVSFNRS